MVERKKEDRTEERYIGRESPGSEEAKEQAIAGRRGAEQDRIAGKGKQPQQASGRAPAARHQQPPEVTKHFEEGQAPSEQGERGHRSAEVVKHHQQGAAPKSGSHSAHAERVEEESQRGAPADEHTREGRQRTPGHRPGHRS